MSPGPETAGRWSCGRNNFGSVQVQQMAEHNNCKAKPVTIPMHGTPKINFLKSQAFKSGPGKPVSKNRRMSSV
jgi:hypothetical protein